MLTVTDAKTRGQVRRESVCIRSKEPTAEPRVMPNSLFDRLIVVREIRMSHRYAITLSTSGITLRNDRGDIYDSGQQITGASTHSEDVTFMIQLVESKGWRRVSIEGTPALRIALIVEARRRDISVDGVGPYVVAAL